MKNMIERGGFRALYRGLSAPTLGFGITFAISFRLTSIFAIDYLNDLSIVINCQCCDSGYGQGCNLIAQYRGKDINKLSLFELSLAGAYTGSIHLVHCLNLDLDKYFACRINTISCTANC